MGDFYIRFWGTRGSIACGGADYSTYGGNTSCLEIRCGDRVFIFDAGTGLRPFGDALTQEGVKRASIYLTHTHFDHICGLPFFAPFYDPKKAFDIWAGHLNSPQSTHDAIEALMAAPVFPVEPDIFQAKVRYHDFAAGDTLDAGDGIVLKTTPLNHPNGAAGYRIEYNGRAACYLTDLEHKADLPDPTLVAFCRDADVLIYDSMYTDEEYRTHKGFGHSTWRQGMMLAKAAGIPRFVPFHHDPSHTDAMMTAIERDAIAVSAAQGIQTACAREGMILVPGQELKAAAA